jgi:serine/threonine protein kinase
MRVFLSMDCMVLLYLCVTVCARCLGDFGLFRIRDASEQTSSTTGYRGTPAFSAPESFAFPPPRHDVAADVFSLAFTMWVICTGQLHPYPPQMPPHSIISSVSSGRRPSLANLPDRLQQLLTGSWCQLPQDRCNTAYIRSELLAALRELSE